MKRLLILTFILTLLVCAAITTAKLAGGNAPPPPFAKWFTNADGTPCEMLCLFGIRPGITKYADVEGMLKANPLTKGYVSPSDDAKFDKNINFFDVSLVQGYMTLSQDTQGLVKTIVFDAPASNNLPITFRDDLLVFGVPYGVSLATYDIYGYDRFYDRNQTYNFEVADSKHKCKFDLSESFRPLQKTKSPSRAWGDLNKPFAETR